MFLNKPPASLCILRLSAIGDVTHVLPALRTLQKAWPDCKITWIIGKLEYQLVHDIEGVEFIIYDKALKREANKQLRDTLKGRQFDVLLHMQISLRSSFASRAIKAPLRLGYDFKRARNLQWLFSNRKINYVPEQHVLDCFLEFPRALGLTPAEPEWNIPVSAADIEFIKQSTPDEYVVINPCASNAVRNWSAENYAAIIDYLAEKHQLKTVLSGGPADFEISFSNEIAALAKTEPQILTARTSLKQLAVLMGQARFVISPDTGPAHIANAMGTPVIGLYANSNPYRTGPYSSIKYTVNKYPDALWETYHKKVDQVRWGRRVRRDDVMEFIKVDDVTSMIEKVISSL